MLPNLIRKHKKRGVRCAVFFVAALLVVAPLEPAFAQSTDSSTQSVTTDSTATPSSSPSPSPTPAPSPATPAPSPSPLSGSSDATQSSGATNQTSDANTKTPATPGTPPPPSGGNPESSPQPVAKDYFNQDAIKVDKNTGALTFSYPIDIPPGRNGLQPDVSLAYNSQNNQLWNILGEGWSINIPYIVELNKSGEDNFYSTSTLQYFTSSLDGELVSTTTVSSTGSSYVARTENGTFNKYTYSSSTNQWTMTDKNGTQYAFGSASDSQQSDPNNASDTYRWMLKQITDTSSNTVVYYYAKDSGQIYPSSTIYTGNGTSTGIFEVDFLRATSTDNVTSSASGFAYLQTGESAGIGVCGTQVQAFVPISGRREAYYKEYERCLGHGGLHECIISKSAWDPAHAPAAYKGGVVTAHAFESELSNRIGLEVRYALKKFLIAYSLVSLQELPALNRLYGCFLLSAPGRVVANASDPILNGLLGVYPLGLSVERERLQQALQFELREIDRYLRQLLAMQRLAVQGESDLAVVGCVAVIEWFMNSFVVRRKKRLYPIKECLMMPPFDSLPTDLRDDLLKIAYRRNAVVHGEPPTRHSFNDYRSIPKSTNGIPEIVGAGLRLYREINLRKLRPAADHRVEPDGNLRSGNQ